MSWGFLFARKVEQASCLSADGKNPLKRQIGKRDRLEACPTVKIL
jgi:hypothetical protein